MHTLHQEKTNTANWSMHTLQLENAYFAYEELNYKGVYTMEKVSTVKKASIMEKRFPLWEKRFPVWEKRFPLW